MISNRVNAFLQEPSAIMEGFVKCAQDPFNQSNPTGYLNFGVAENHLMDDLLLPQFQKSYPLQKNDLQYFDFSGTSELKNATSQFLNKYLHINIPNSQSLIYFNGLSAACEALSYCMFDEGDYLMIPTPYYTGFKYDFQNRFKVNFLEVPLRSENHFQHDISDFKKAYENFSEKEKVKAILITHPHNPTGEVLTESFLKDIVDFAKGQNLEIITDEVYALTRMDQKPHKSLMTIGQDYSDHIHFMYGLAKDFTMAGLKVGVFYSPNEKLTEAMMNMTYFHNVNSYTQKFLLDFFKDYEFIDHFLKTNNDRLLKAKNKLKNNLKSIPIIDGESGLFFLLDLREKLKEPTFKAEKELYLEFLNEHKIFFTAGEDLGLKEPGFFRVCFARKPENIEELNARLARIL